MPKVLLVLRNEIVNTVSRPAFLITAIGIPLIGFLVFGGISALGGRAPEAGSVTGSTAATEEIQVEGYVDRAGLIRFVPDTLPAGALVAFPDEASARQALEAGQITAYYVVPTDYVESGEFVYIHPEAKALATTGQDWVMRWTLLANLVDGDLERANRVWNPLDPQVTALSGEPEQEEDNPAEFYVPYGSTLIFYFILMIGSSLMLNSIIKEKQNRVMEILMLSLSPLQILVGKIVGLGLAGLLQAAIWLGSGYVLLGLMGSGGTIPAGFQIHFSVVLWGIAFFLLGYTIYASLMTGLGALAPNMREATQVVGLIIMPLLVPLFLISVLITAPNAPISVALSLFPLTAPIAMMTRLTAGGVPTWQPPLAAVLMALSAWLIVRAVAGMFHAQHLLSGQPFSLKRYLGAILGRTQ